MKISDTLNNILGIVVVLVIGVMLTVVEIYKHLMIYVYYFLGDLISKTTMRVNGVGYSLYNKLMKRSVDLDTEGEVWKYVAPDYSTIKRVKK